MQDYATTLNLNINEELSEDLAAFFEKQAPECCGASSTSHNSNNDLITYDD